jgi:hypothetical protein
VTEQASVGELERALARPDIASLRLHLADYRDYSNDDLGQATYSRRHGAAGNFNYVMDAHKDPDLALAFVMLALSEYDDPFFIGLIAAGPLEEVLMFNLSPEVVDRVVAEAGRTPRFRWMLKRIYLPKADWAREALEKAAKDIGRNDAMPAFDR